MCLWRVRKKGTSRPLRPRHTVHPEHNPPQRTSREGKADNSYDGLSQVSVTFRPHSCFCINSANVLNTDFASFVSVT